MGLLHRRVVRSAAYSIKGLRATWKEEEAFRVEIVLFLFLAPLGLYLGNTRVEQVLLVGTLLLVLIVELLNSSVESAIDRIGSEENALAGRAKDQGSAAVFVTLGLVVMVWTILLWP